MRKDDQKAMEVFSGTFTEGEALSILKSAEEHSNIEFDGKLAWFIHFVKTDTKKLKRFLKCLEMRAEECPKETQKPIYKARIEEVKNLLKKA